MRTQPRPRHYLPAHWLAVLRPVLRYSANRDAYLLRGIGDRMGPVFRLERRGRGRPSYGGEERRQMSAA
jgi:hypothetical protein